MSLAQTTAVILPLHYQDHQIRVVIDNDGEWWWVARDVGELLGLVDVRTSLRSIPESHKGRQILPTPGGPQHMNIVDEFGFYGLAWQSNKPEAEALKEWTYALLKQLRRRGVFSFPVMPIPYQAPARVPTESAPLAPPDPTLDQRPLFPEYPKISPAPHTHTRPSTMQEDRRIEITPRMVHIWRELRDSRKWRTVKQVAAFTKLPVDSMGKQLRRLTQQGMLDVQDGRPHWYRASDQAKVRNPEFYQKLTELLQIHEDEGLLPRMPEMDWRPEDFE